MLLSLIYPRDTSPSTSCLWWHMLKAINAGWFLVDMGGACPPQPACSPGCWGGFRSESLSFGRQSFSHKPAVECLLEGGLQCTKKFRGTCRF